MPQTLTCGRVVSTPQQQAYAGLSDSTDVAKTKSFECRTCVIWERRQCLLVFLSWNLEQATTPPHPASPPLPTLCGLSMFE